MNGESMAIKKSDEQRSAEKNKFINSHNNHRGAVQTRKNTVVAQAQVTRQKSANGSVTNPRAVQKNLTGYSNGSHGGATTGGVIKTIILPNEDMNKLGVEAQVLREHIEAQRKLYEDTVAAYNKDRLIRMQEFDLKERDFRQACEELQ